MVTTQVRSYFSGAPGSFLKLGKMSDMSYPSRPRRDPLPEFTGQRGRWLPPGSTLRLTRFVVEEYNDGRSLREISELVDRSHREVANILNAAGVPRRPVGAAQVRQSTHRVANRRRFQARALYEDATKVVTTPSSPE